MVQPDFLSPQRLKHGWFSVLLSNPLTKDEIANFEFMLWDTMSFFPSQGSG
jgi:hypothetical protein